jgi:uncharacterized protein YkwD
MKVCITLLATFATLLTIPAQAIDSAALLKLANETRIERCGKQPALTPLKLNKRLSAAGQHMRRANDLSKALARVDYRADRSSVIHLRGNLNVKTVEQLLIKHYCKVLTDSTFTEAGIHSSNREAWLLLAKPFVVPAAADANQVARRVLQLVNDARAKPRRCGGERFVAVGALKLNDKLTRAASLHSQEMAKRGTASHTGANGSDPGDRATRAGYIWRNVGENVAAGQLNADEVVEGWLSSAYHCTNIMAPEFTELGVAFAVNPKSKSGIYWTQMFGRQR